MTQKPQKAGRPLKPAHGPVTIGLRVPAHLKNQLAEAARRNFRTLSQETERRLSRSFSAEALREDALSLALTGTMESANEQFGRTVAEIGERVVAEAKGARQAEAA